MKEFIITQTITIRDYQSLDRYFNDVTKIKLIGADEELLLAERIKFGDQEALKRLVSSNLRFVISIAKRYQNQGLSIGDLINEGNIGLIIAAKRFNHDKGFKFISYAVWWIRQAITFAIAEQSRVVYMPYNQITQIGRFHKTSGRLEQLYQRKPSISEIAEYMEIPIFKVEEIIACLSNEISLDKPLSGDSDLSMMDFIPSGEQDAEMKMISAGNTELLNISLDKLPNRQRQVICLFFGLNRLYPVTLEDIALELKISVRQARSLKNEALRRLHNNLIAQKAALDY